MKRTIRIVQIILIFLGVVAIVVFGYFYSRNHFCTDEIPNTNNIYIYQAELEYGSINQRYAKHRDLSVDENLYFRCTTLEDIPDIAALEGVNGIYLFDDAYFLEDGGLIDQVIDEDPAATASVPQDVYVYFSNCSGIWSIFEIVAGEAPADGAGEIALSADWLEQRYGITDPESAIGQQLEFQGETYTLSGIQTYSFAWISFQPGDELGYYTYDPDTFEQFEEKELSFWEEQDGDYYLSAMVECQNLAATQEQVQDSLVTAYPGSNYLSKSIVTAWKASVNHDFWRTILVACVVIVIIVGGTCLILQLWSRKKRRWEEKNRQP